MPIGSTTSAGHTQCITTVPDTLEVTEHLTVTYFLNFNLILIIAHAGIRKLNFCFAASKKYQPKLLYGYMSIIWLRQEKPNYF